jgi:hypothetical protein
VEQKDQNSKVRNEKGAITTNTKKSMESSETTLRTYIPINWKILKKCTNFLIFMTTQN